MTDVKKVAIALSGGIDSLVAAHILKNDYSEVFGIHFSTGYEDKNLDLSSIGEQIGIEIKHVDLSSLFEDKIVNYFINTYLSGKTPNPCIRCNKIVKFGALLEAAISFGADALATGHYAKIRRKKNSYTLVKGSDNLKEQSYFLSLLSDNELKNILFPLGDLTKETIKKIARDANLTPVEKKESQDICFLKNESIAEFIQSKVKIKPSPGNIITTDGKVIGTHKGLYNFTIGQRRGINCPASEPYYVKKIEAEKNNLIVCFKNELLIKRFSVTSLCWIKKDLEFPLKVSTKIRYNHKQSLSTLIEQDNNSFIDVLFDQEQFAVTPGQTAVFYENNEIIGSGIIL
ncbi:MAG: tRNA 2-thiouridine(34) synthase MnmA [Desulfobacteraceae bacterium]|nr:tRNA 2-thiouridine(34) synthase MnmA [Desulfobacteraceae bacterium]